MLKKLVKYGNSNALILDKAILDLLNIQEGSIVKLQTDGKSLMISPEQTATINDVTMSGEELMRHTLQTRVKKSTELFEQANPVNKAQLTQWMPGTQKGIKLQNAFTKIMEKYKNEMALLNSKQFSEAINELADKHHGAKDSAEYLKDFFALRLQFAPNLATMDQELIDAQKELGLPDCL